MMTILFVSDGKFVRDSWNGSWYKITKKELKILRELAENGPVLAIDTYGTENCGWEEDQYEFRNDNWEPVLYSLKGGEFYEKQRGKK